VQLVQAEVLYQRGAPPQATYLFKHALIQEAAYQSLLKSIRQHYHQCIAQVLAAQFPETTAMHPELLARHYTEAGLQAQALAYVAARTSRIRLGTSVLIMPYRNPVATAKMFATLDQMSGGRVIAGVGVGWCEAEFAALGVPFHERGVRTTEYLRIWQACWAPDPVAFQGQFLSFADMYIKPKPLQQPHPPIWIGGSSRAALRRAAAFAQVWQPTQMSAADLHEHYTYLRTACARIGRPDIPATRMSFRVNFSAITGSTARSATAAAERPIGQGTPAQVAEDIRRLRHEAGLDALQINFNGCQSLAQLLASMTLFMQEVKPLVEQ